MQLNDILQSISIKHRETQFVQPPKETFMVWYDDITRRGADNLNLIKEHAVSFELYAYKPDAAAEQQVEDALDAVAVEWQKTARQWIDSEKVYLTIYDFYFTTKE